MVTLAIPKDAARVSGPPQGQWTVADWEALPDDGRLYEILGGILYMSTSPSIFHQWVIQQLYVCIGLPAQQRGLAFTFMAPVGLLLPTGDAVQPDFVLVKSERAAIIHDRRIRGVPDLIVEVLSPGSRDYDEGVKLEAYARAGLPEYAVIDPAERQLRLYRLADGAYGPPLVFDESAALAFACLPDIRFTVGGLFAGSPDTTL